MHILGAFAVQMHHIGAIVQMGGWRPAAAASALYFELSLAKWYRRNMATLTELLDVAGSRAEKAGLPYTGALTPTEAHAFLRLAPGARLVDVRTRAEWNWVGRIPGALEIELMSYPGNQPNWLMQNPVNDWWWCLS